MLKSQESILHNRLLKSAYDIREHTYELHMDCCQEFVLDIGSTQWGPQ